ncbi:hypothetical protein [Gilliamella intestini]|uniref:Uncharacterized protein n=1 Tax=Gilliamella intestini TaxID=1798183 RepID=A0A1C4DB98_9GAMM|nr:hypothetical protein [Gilliamella intestini]SCC28644.1 hypothetical protein GA0061080_106616 [Gilliamella intestini]
MKNLFKKNYNFVIESFNFNEYSRTRLVGMEEQSHVFTYQVNITPKNIYLSTALDRVLVKTLATVITNGKMKNSDEDLLLFTLTVDFSLEFSFKRKLKDKSTFIPDLDKFKSISTEKIIPEINSFLKKTQYANIELLTDNK